mgnify:CR=1 FL=1
MPRFYNYVILNSPKLIIRKKHIRWKYKIVAKEIRNDIQNAEVETAYTGNRRTAKKAVVKQNHKAVVKWIQADAMKCVINGGTIFRQTNNSGGGQNKDIFTFFTIRSYLTHTIDFLSMQSSFAFSVFLLSFYYINTKSLPFMPFYTAAAFSYLFHNKFRSLRVKLVIFSS